MNAPKDIVELAEGLSLVQEGAILEFERAQSLVIADLHLGYESSDEQTSIPAQNLDTILKKIQQMLSICKSYTRSPETLIINGDLKQGFGLLNTQERKEIQILAEFCRTHFSRTIIIAGNHDNAIQRICKINDIAVKKHMKLGKFFIIHGDKMPKRIGRDVQTLIVGHEHPCISFKERPRETYKCHVWGSINIGLKNYDVLFLPSMFSLSEGTDILKNDFIGPFMPKALNLNAFVVNGKIFEFGDIKHGLFQKI